MNKISLLGAGNIGGTLAQFILQKGLANVELIDISEDLAKGKALDLKQAGLGGNIHGGGDFSRMKDSDVVVVTAGVARKPGMSRDDLLSINASIIQALGAHIKTFCPNAFVIVVTNPLDIMVWLMHKTIGGNSQKIVGMAGILDTARFASFLAEELGVNIEDIHSLVLGGHGDFMVPLLRYTSISGIPLAEWVEKGAISRNKLENIIDRTKNGGAELVALLKTGSAYVAPASAILSMITSYILNEKKIFPCSSFLNGEYSVKDMFVGVPIIIGKEGVERIIELSLNTEETAMMKKSVKAIQELLKTIDHIFV